MITSKSVTYFLIFSLVLGLLHQLQIFSRCLWINRTFNRSGPTRAIAPDIWKAFVRVGNAGLLHKLKLYGTPGQIFDLILSFLGNRGLRVFLDGGLHKKIQLMLEFLRAPLLLMMLLYIPSVSSHLNLDSLALTSILEFDLNALLTGAGSILLISMMEKLNWFRLARLITLVLLMKISMGLFLIRNHL